MYLYFLQMDFGQFRTVNVITQEEFQSITPSVSTPHQQVPPPPPVSLQSSKFITNTPLYLYLHCRVIFPINRITWHLSALFQLPKKYRHHPSVMPMVQFSLSHCQPMCPLPRADETWGPAPPAVRQTIRLPGSTPSWRTLVTPQIHRYKRHIELYSSIL